MFTGIITDVGRIRGVEKRGDTRFTIATAYDAEGIDIGASIACAGRCLTVVEKGKDGEGDWCAADVSQESPDMPKLWTWACPLIHPRPASPLALAVHVVLPSTAH